MSQPSNSSLVRIKPNKPVRFVIDGPGSRPQKVTLQDGQELQLKVEIGPNGEAKLLGILVAQRTRLP